MTPEQIRLVRDSFTRVEPIAQQVVGLFYGKLFEPDTDLCKLFRGDMKAQGARLESKCRFMSEFDC